MGESKHKGYDIPSFTPCSNKNGDTKLVAMTVKSQPIFKIISLPDSPVNLQ